MSTVSQLVQSMSGSAPRHVRIQPICWLMLTLIITQGLVSQVARLESSPEVLESAAEGDSSPASVLVEGLPALLCDGWGKFVGAELVSNVDQVCPPTPRLPELPADASSVEQYGWWEHYSPDRDRNGMDDRRGYEVAGV